jgi:hypothetical protein
LWSILEEDVRRSPKLLGEWDSSIDPPLSLLDSAAADPDPAGGTPTGSGSSGSTATASEMPPADPNPVGGTVTGDGSSGSTRTASEAPANAQPDSTPTRRGYVTKSGGGGGIIERPSGL